MKIIDHLLFADRRHLITVRGEAGDAPRPPLIGVRTIVANKLRLMIDGNRRYVTLKTEGWS
jgi:hypothetical protein